MANLLWLVQLKIGHVTAYRILVFWHYMTCPHDHTNVFFPLDSILYQPVLCGCT